MRSLFFTLLLSFLLLFSMAIAQRETQRPNDQASEPMPAHDINVKPVPSKKKLREGTVFQEQSAIIRPVGGRMVVYFQPGDERYLCLENICLERIAQTIREAQGPTYWKVDGLFTEYQGENYILLKRAIQMP